MMLFAATLLLLLAPAPPARVSVQGASGVGGALAEPARASFPELEWRTDGCGAAIKALLAGSADVTVSTRAPRRRELELAERLGMTLREHVLAFDALAVIVHPDNRVEALTLDQLAALFSGDVARWMGVGGANATTRPLVPSHLSGRREVLRARVLAERDFGGSAEAVETAEDMIRLVATDTRAVGVVSMSTDRSTVKTVTLEGFAPTPETVVRGEYPLWYAVYLYTLDNPPDGVHELLSWLLLQRGQRHLSDAGFVPAPGAAPLRRVPLGSSPGRTSSSVLSRVSFDPGSPRLGRQQRDLVDAVIERALGSSDALLLVGHSTSDEDRALSEARARAVFDRVASRGVPADRLEVEAVGDEEPIALDTASSRRVDIWFLPPR